MSIKLRLVAMNFLQFFVWGAWLITIGAYWFQYRHWSGAQFGAIFSTMGIASLFMPSLMGVIADKWLNAEKLYGLLHIGGAIVLFMVPSIDNPNTLFWVMLLNMMCYMPTISLAIAVAYNALKTNGADVVLVFPPIRVWGTIGFIAAMWTVSLLHLETSGGQFYVASGAALLLGLYAFTLPKCPPRLRGKAHTSWLDTLGLTSFALFRNSKMAIFFVFAMLLGAALQLTNAYGDTYLHDFAKVDAQPGVVRIEVEGRQWTWEARYPGPDGAFGTADDALSLNRVVVPAGAPVLVELASPDVIHGFSVPSLRVKRDVVPGRIGAVTFTVRAPGTYEIACQQLCGVGHYKMRGELVALSPEDFAAWLARGSDEAKRAFDPDDAAAHWAWPWKAHP